MKHLKILGLLVFAAATTMVVAAPASADYVTTTTGGAASTPTIHLVNEGGHVAFSNPIAIITCNSTAEGTVSGHGAGANASSLLSTFTFTGCTNNWHVTVEKREGFAYGVLAIKSTKGHDGTLTSTWTRIVATRFGITCVYGTYLTHIGTLTGGNPATLHIEASIPIDTIDSSPLCGSGNAEWGGAYVTTSALYVGSS